MRILITGNLGYVGAAVTKQLRQHGRTTQLIGFDTGFFAHCITGAQKLPELMLDEQHFGDIREFPVHLLRGVDAIIHLAAISNDPMGQTFEKATIEVNFEASVKLAQLAAERGVGNFVFASSCSVYGAGPGARNEDDELNPLTTYAHSKIATEKALETFAGDMNITCLRFATACGMSARLRLDLVLNDFVACAVTTGEITVLSDGLPWRPLIDVSDMARALEWASMRTVDRDRNFLVLNAGSNEWNFQIKDLANRVASAVEGTKVQINPAAPPDRRSYRVDFSKLQSMAPGVIRTSIDESIDQLRDGLLEWGFDDRNFRASRYMRLKVLEEHVTAGRLLPALRWQ